MNRQRCVTRTAEAASVVLLFLSPSAQIAWPQIGPANARLEPGGPKARAVADANEARLETTGQPRIRPVPHIDPSALAPTFVENRGQFDERVRFQFRSGATTLWMTNSGIVFDTVHKRTAGTKAVSGSPGSPRSAPPSSAGDLTRLAFAEDLIGASPNLKVEARIRQPSLYNYFSGNDPKK